MNEFNRTKIHGSLTTNAAMEIFDSGEIVKGDYISFPNLYRLRYNEQEREDFRREANEIQSYLCTKDFR